MAVARRHPMVVVAPLALLAVLIGVGVWAIEFSAAAYAKSGQDEARAAGTAYGVVLQSSVAPVSAGRRGEEAGLAGWGGAARAAAPASSPPGGWVGLGWVGAAYSLGMPIRSDHDMWPLHCRADGGGNWGSSQHTGGDVLLGGPWFEGHTRGAYYSV